MEIIAVLLTVGNYLNQGTNKGNTTNFQIDFLAKLTSIKGAGKFCKSSLLEWLVLNITSTAPELLEVAVILEALEPSLKVDPAYLAQKLGEFQQGLNLLRGEIDSMQQLTPVQQIISEGRVTNYQFEA